MNSTVRVVLVSPRNPLNIGAAARAMSNFGFAGLHLVNPYHVAFREVRSAVGAGAVIQSACEYTTTAEAIADCSLIVGTTSASHRELRQTIRRLEEAGRLIREHPGTVALLFGSEKHGLSNDDLSHCHWLLEIPSRPGHRSMNLGQAVAVCLYELIRSDAAAVHKVRPHEPVSEQQSETLRERLQEALQLSGYYDHTAVAGADRRVRELLHRMNLSKHDAVIWLGILRQLLWKLSQQ